MLGKMMTGATVAALLAASACSSGPSQTSTRTDGFRGVSALVIDHEIGSVSITRGKAVTVSRTLTKSGRKVPAEHLFQDGATLHVGASCPSSFNASVCAVDYRITAPAEVAVTAKAGANAVTVEGITAPVAVTTDSGSITLTDVASVRAETRSGLVSVRQGRSGAIEARGDSGSITIHLGRGASPVTASATSGDIRVTTPPGGGPFHVTARTRSGAAKVGVRQSPSGAPIRLTTDSGDITVS